MTPFLLEIIREPQTGNDLTLFDAEYDSDGNIVSGYLASKNGSRYPIISGIPRFVESVPTSTVK